MLMRKKSTYKIKMSNCDTFHMSFLLQSALLFLRYGLNGCYFISVSFVKWGWK